MMLFERNAMETVDIEPNAEGEPDHCYVVYTQEDGTVYEGRLWPKPKRWALEDASIFVDSLGLADKEDR